MGPRMATGGRRLVGRPAIVDALDRRVAALCQPGAAPGPVEVVLLGGEPGIGKTATAGWMAAAAQRAGAETAWGICWDGDGAPAFWPWAQLLRALVRSGAIADTADLAPLTGQSVPGEGERFRTFVAVTEALQGASVPLLLVLEDLQWADAASLRLLDFVTRHCRRCRVLIVATYRDLDPAPSAELRTLLSDLSGRAESHALAGLDQAGTAQLLADVMGPVDDGVATAVHARTGGNPFFVQETARLLATGGGQSVPVGVGEAITRRVAALPPPVGALLRAAALIGAAFDARVLASVAELSDVETVAALDRGVGVRVLRSDGSGGYRFEHDLFREALAAQVDPGDRAQLHGRIAHALEPAGASNAVLAYHCGQSGTPGVAQAIRYSAAAAQDASAALAHEEATRLRRQVIALGDASAQAQIALADAARQSGEYDQARTAYLAAATALPARAALGLHELGGGAEHSHQVVIDLLERALSDVDPQPASDVDTAATLRPRLLAALARELADGPHRDPVRAATLADDAIAAARATDPAALAFCLFAKHDVIWGPGSPAQRLTLADEMAAAADDLEMAFQAAFCQLIALLDVGDSRAELALLRMRQVAERSRLPRHRYLVASREAALAAMQGRFADARDAIETADWIGEMIGEPDTVGVRMTQLLVMAATREGVHGVKRLFDASGSFGPPESGPEMQAMVRAAAGDPAGGAAVLAASPPALQRSLFRWRALAALAFDTEVLILAGAAEQTRQAYDDLLPYADEVIGIGGATTILGPVALYLGLLAASLGQYAPAAEHFEQAIAVARRLGARPVLARAQAELGLCLLASAPAQTLASAPAQTLASAPARAEQLLSEAGVLADELGLPLVTERLAHRPAPSGNRLHRDGPVWTLEYAGRSVHLPDTKGLRDLAVLLGAPGEEVAATSLVGDAPVPGSDELLDAAARAAYRSRLETLDAELDRAALRDRRDAVAQLTAEREALIAELNRAYGLGGRSRRLGDLGERARSTVTARIRDTLRKIEQVHPELGTHLRESVNTGRSCSYRPAAPTRWVVSHSV